MDKVQLERLDHLGVIASVVKAIGLIDRMNARLGPDPQAVLTPGEAVAGLILKGLGCAHRPLSLPPQLLASPPRELWWHDGGRAERVNRFQRGRRRDEADADGGDLLFHELALGMCARAGLDLRFNHLETTSVSLSGADLPERDEQARAVPPGYASDHRPDLKPGVVALMVSHDGGLPCGRPSWDGHPSAIELLQARAQAWRAAVQHAPHPRDLRADATLSHEDQAPHLRHLGWITRLPNTMGSGSEVITPALASDWGHRLDAHPRAQRLELCHDGMAPCWLVGYSQAAYERAAATLNHARQREREASHTPLVHRQAQRFATPEAAHEARMAWAQGWTSHQGASSHRSDHPRDARKGRPPPRLPVKAIAWHIQAHVRPAAAAIAHQQQRHACVVIGTNIGPSEVQDTEVITADTRQSQVDGGCRLRNEPRWFVSSWCVKTPCRIQGLLRVMTLA